MPLIIPSYPRSPGIILFVLRPILIPFAVSLLFYYLLQPVVNTLNKVRTRGREGGREGGRKEGRREGGKEGKSIKVTYNLLLSTSFS